MKCPLLIKINANSLHLRFTEVHGLPHFGQLHWFPAVPFPFLSLPPLPADELPHLLILSSPRHETLRDLLAKKVIAASFSLEPRVCSLLIEENVLHDDKEHSEITTTKT